MSFLKKNKGNLVFVLLLVLMIIPQTRTPIQVFVQRIFSFNPSEISEEKRDVLHDFDWELSHIDGEIQNLKSSKGKVIVINVWATWCPPCIAEMPSLQSLYTEYQDTVDFYFISQESQEKLDRFMRKNKYTFPVYIPQTDAPEQLFTRALPTTYVIAKDGSVIIQKKGAADWNGEMMHGVLNRLLKE
jgi:thiol-disulfide isomerase/thioredoxin